MPNPSETPGREALDAFVARWDGTELAERANKDMFLTELCAVLDVAAPEPASGGGGSYRFERKVTHFASDDAATSNFIDLYKRGCFVLEAKQGGNPRRLPSDPSEDKERHAREMEHRRNVRGRPGWSSAMLKAKGQAERYAKDLPAEEGWPPFLIVCDVGFCFDLYADFSGTGKHYAQFPDRDGFRVYLPDLRDPAIRERLRTIWRDPLALDPARVRDEVTRDIAKLLARLVRSLEGPKERPRHPPTVVAIFLMRCIFCMFAQSVGLLPTPLSFTALLKECRGNPHAFVGLVGDLWRTMNEGGFSPAIRGDLPRFNGGLFAPGPDGPAEPLALTADQIDLLIIAAAKN